MEMTFNEWMCFLANVEDTNQITYLILKKAIEAVSRDSTLKIVIEDQLATFHDAILLNVIEDAEDPTKIYTHTFYCINYGNNYKDCMLDMFQTAYNIIKEF